VISGEFYWTLLGGIKIPRLSILSVKVWELTPRGLCWQLLTIFWLELLHSVQVYQQPSTAMPS